MAPEKTLIYLDSAHGPVTREVSTKPPRPATDEELRTVDLKNIGSEVFEERLAIAKEVKRAAESTGFFYIKNHGIDQRIIEDAYNESMKLAVHMPIRVHKHMSPAEKLMLGVGSSCSPLRQKPSWTTRTSDLSTGIRRAIPLDPTDLSHLVSFFLTQTYPFSLHQPPY